LTNNIQLTYDTLRGISKIRLVDFDYVTLSSLNRHATAVLTDVGTPKVICVEKTLKHIAKWVQVDSRIELWRKDESGHLLEGADWVIGMFVTFLIRSRSRKSPLTQDAIDNIQTKVDLLKYCHSNNIKVRN
jgi:tRNA A37 threonylcarbamoyladenosine dehydratase